MWGKGEAGVGEEGGDVGVLRFPRAHEAVAVFADEFVEVPAAGFKGGDGGGGEFDEDAVGFGGGDEARAEGDEAGGEGAGLAVGVGGVTEPCAVGENGGPLGGGEAHLRRELAGLFHAAVELAGEGAVEEDDGFGGEEAVFRAAETEDVEAGAPSEIGGGVARVGAGGGVGEAGAVEVDDEVVGVGPIGEGAEFGGGVDGPEFGGLGEGEGAGFGKMHAVTAVEDGREVGGAELGVRGVDGDDFTAAGEKFGGAALVGFDVGEGVAEDAVVALAEGGERECVGGGAVEDKVDFAVGLEDVAEVLFGAGGVGVVAVAGDAVGVGGGERGEGFRAEAGGVVAGERVVGAGA